MATQSTQNERQRLCSVCAGRGVVGDDRRPIRCASCGGTAAVWWIGGTWVTWRKPLDQLHLLEERIEHTVRAVIDGTLILFGVVGAFMGALGIASVLRDASTSGTFIVQELAIDFWSLRGTPMLVFWLSIVTDLYLFYRFDQMRRIISPIPSDAPSGLPVPSAPFTAILNGPSVDVSRSFTRPTQRIVERARTLAAAMRHRTIEPLHLLAAAAGDDDVALALLRLSIPPEKIRGQLRRGLATVESSDGDPTLSLSAREVLVTAYGIAQRSRLIQVTPPHLLEALANVGSSAQDILFDLGADADRMKNVVLWSLMQGKLFHAWSSLRQRALTKPRTTMDRAMTAQATPILDRLSVDLTQAARRGTLPLVVDRERELEDAFRVVESGRHNVILVGDKGVGTTSLLQAIAERMAAEDVPEVLQDKRLVQFSVARLVAVAQRAGGLESLFQEAITEIVKAGNVVLAIEDLQDLVGVASAGNAALDLSSILGKVLESRAFVAFATTTPDGYRRAIEPSALFTAFEKVDVGEVEPDVAIQILEARSGPVEARHRVFFSYAAIEAIVRLSIRYIHDRYLPEKALTLLDEVAAYTRAAKGDRAVVTEEDAASVVGRRTHANVAAVTEDEATKLLKLEERMHERMIGQAQAVTAVANALRRSRAELRDPKRPIGVFLFLGPTGVGKTELAKTVAEVYFGDEKNMIRLDMSEYQDPTSLVRLLGAPEGYRGAGGGYLTEAVRTNPFSLVLLDELEKAHPDVLNVFLQVFDDGRLTDASGRTIDFTNTIIIATSNAGTEMIQERVRAGRSAEAIKTELVESVLGRFYRPEFLNRFDDIVVFRPLSQPEIASITRLLLRKIAQQLERRGISLRVTDEAIAELAAAGFDPVFGARPLRRLLQERVDNALATFLLTGKLNRRDVAVLESGGIVTVERAKKL